MADNRFSLGDITKFYVSNLPTGCTPWELTSFLGVFGEMARTYIAKRMDKQGNMLSFVNFKNIRDKPELERSLANVKMDGNKLVINIARYAAENADYLSKMNAPKQKISVIGSSNQGHGQVQNGGQVPGQAWRNKLSYKDSVSLGLEGNGTLRLQRNSCRVLHIANEVQAFGDLIGKAVVGRALSLDVMVSLRRLMTNSGIGFHSIHYIGGLTVLLNFDNINAAGEFACSHEVRTDWFGQLDVRQGQSLPYDRIAWLKVMGVPINLVTEEVFRQIGQSLGKVVHVDGLGTEDKDLSFNRIGVLVGDGSHISDEVSLMWNEKCFKDWVQEDSADWIPDFIKTEEEDDSDLVEFLSEEDDSDPAPVNEKPHMESQQTSNPVHESMQNNNEGGGEDSNVMDVISPGNLEKAPFFKDTGGSQ
ncbi:putative RNA recognition motif domain, nucleotide-binding alpha-beta plait domain superfamily [Helianthus debilis subsp. tardiflorus]